MKIFLAVKKDTIIHEKLKNYNFLFGDYASLLRFKRLNNIENVFLYKDIPIDCKVFISEGMFFQILILKLLIRGIKDISVCSDKDFPNKITIIYSIKDMIPDYKIFNEIVFIANYSQSSALLAYKLLNENFKLIALKNTGERKKIYEFSKLIKEANQNFYIVLYGKTSTPKRDLMSNSVDFVLLNEAYLYDLKDNLHNLSKIKSLYFYDENFSVIFNEK